MVFSSPVFLGFFLPLLFLLYCCSRYRNLALLGGSLFFYSWGEPKALLVMLVAILFNYASALMIGKSAENGSERKARWLLGISVAVNIGILLVYKYLSFAIGNLNLAFKPLGFSLNDPAIPLPIGISFYIFQTLSYLVDVYRREVAPQKNLCYFALYVSLFPQLIAGPIVRYKNIADEFSDRELHLDNVSAGMQRFAVGLAKKILVADPMAMIADRVFTLPVTEVPAIWCWIGAMAYMLQIFYDFSGYSDMAIGLGRVFNFRFPENFNLPYSAVSVQDFWRRWHISLSSWFRDYLYIPLGGNRCGKWRTHLNLLIVFLLCGLWHGAAWNFIVWGFYHGFGLIIERAGLKNILEKLPRFAGNLYVLFFVLIGWVIFRSPSMTYAWQFLKVMFTGNPQAESTAFPYLLEFFSFSNVLIFLIGWIFSYEFAVKWFQNRPPAVKTVLAFLLLAVAYIFAMTSLFSPFIYFRF